MRDDEAGRTTRLCWKRSVTPLLVDDTTRVLRFPEDWTPAEQRATRKTFRSYGNPEAVNGIGPNCMVHFGSESRPQLILQNIMVDHSRPFRPLHREPG